MAKELFVAKIRNQNIYKVYEGELKDKAEDRKYVGMLEISEADLLALDTATVQETDKGTAKELNKVGKLKGSIEPKYDAKTILDKVKDYATKVKAIKDAS